MNGHGHDEGSPVVSCVIIFYNAERFIGDAIKSVIAQDYESWELLIVDDGSRDGARSIVDAYARDYPQRIRVLEHEGGANRGKSASRNLGFRHARGRYIAMLDADDFWLSEKLSQQVALLDRFPDIGILYSKVSFWYDWTGRPRDRLKNWTSVLGLRADRIYDGKQVLRRLLLATARGAQDISPYPSASMFRHDLLDVAGGFDDDFPRLYDDMVFFTKVFLKTNVYLHGGIWTKYRNSPDDEYSLSYQIADASGEWSGDQPNPIEKSYFERVRSYIDGEPRAGWRLRFTARLALARYSHPWLYRLDNAIWRLRITISSALRNRAHAVVRALRNDKRRLKSVSWGTLKTPSPLFAGESTRGTAVDREFARQFCLRFRDRITGAILEYGDDSRSRNFGHAIETVIVGRPGNVPPADLRFDCIIAIDIVQYVPDIASFLATIRNRLKEGGTALISFPALLPPLAGTEDLWRFTYAGVCKLLQQNFPGDCIEVHPYGNVASAIAALHGMGTRDLEEGLLRSHGEEGTVMLFAAIERTK